MILMMVMMMMDQACLFPGNLIKLVLESSLKAFHIELVSKFSFLQYNQEDADEYKCALRLEKYFDKELSRVGLVDESQYPKVIKMIVIKMIMVMTMTVIMAKNMVRVMAID